MSNSVRQKYSSNKSGEIRLDTSFIGRVAFYQHRRERHGRFGDEGVGAEDGGGQRRLALVLAHVVVDDVADQKVESGENGAAKAKVRRHEKQKNEAREISRKEIRESGQESVKGFAGGEGGSG